LKISNHTLAEGTGSAETGADTVTTAGFGWAARRRKTVKEKPTRNFSNYQQQQYWPFSQLHVALQAHPGLI
jgi:hypothetical protein